MKKSFILKTLLIVSSIFSVALGYAPVSAASFTATASVQEVAPGDSFTIRIGGSCIGRVNLSVNNGTISQSAIWVEENYVSVTVTAGTSGSVIVIATPETGFSDPDANEYKPGARSVSIKIVTPSKPPVAEEKPSQPTTKPNQPTNNKPSQDTQTTKPQPIDTPNDQPNDSNNIENKNEPKPIQIEYSNQNLTIITSLEGIQLPNGFNLGTYTFDGQTFDIAEKDNLTLIYATNATGQNAFYILDRTNNTCTDQLTPFNIDGKQFFLIGSTDDIADSIYYINNGSIAPYKATQPGNKATANVLSNHLTWIVIFALGFIIIILGSCLIYITRPNKSTLEDQPTAVTISKTPAKASTAGKAKPSAKVKGTNHEKRS